MAQYFAANEQSFITDTPLVTRGEKKKLDEVAPLIQCPVVLIGPGETTFPATFKIHIGQDLEIQRYIKANFGRDDMDSSAAFRKPLMEYYVSQLHGTTVLHHLLKTHGVQTEGQGRRKAMMALTLLLCGKRSRLA